MELILLRAFVGNHQMAKLYYKSKLKCFGTLNESVLKIKDLSKPSILI